mmetsp:Transcript_34626/g.87025  ORF Transcript_34626/g.87025 Transcript_34626/m.87025 type:complete len:205 (+) Transcript_34626:677-1291(+)
MPRFRMVPVLDGVRTSTLPSTSNSLSALGTDICESAPNTTLRLYRPGMRLGKLARPFSSVSFVSTKLKTCCCNPSSERRAMATGERDSSTDTPTEATSPASRMPLPLESPASWTMMGPDSTKIPALISSGVVRDLMRTDRSPLASTMVVPSTDLVSFSCPCGSSLNVYGNGSGNSFENVCRPVESVVPARTTPVGVVRVTRALP